jgi:hypothetical protein
MRLLAKRKLAQGHGHGIDEIGSAQWRAAERPQETLLIEWPEGEDAPTKYW